MKQKRTMNKQMYWVKGGCEVEVLGAGHYPTSIIAKLPNGKETEIEIDELKNTDFYN